MDVFYYFSDHLKTASVITDSLGNIKSESDFYPWGGELQFVTTIPTTTSSPAKNAIRKPNSIISGPDITRMGWDAGSQQIGVQRRSRYRMQILAIRRALNLYGFVGEIPRSEADPDGHNGGVMFLPQRQKSQRR